MRKFLIILVVVLVGVTSLQLLATKDRTTQKTDMEQTAGVPESQLGGAFTLTDHNGKIVHDTDYHGQVMLVFFGFTHCPDTCPVTVAMLSKTMELLGDQASQVVPVFITIDPQRDDPATLKDFLSNFDQRIVGLTGTPEQIAQVADLYKVYSARTDEEGEKPSAKKDYNMDHSAYIYMMGKDGKFVRIFPYNVTEIELSHAVERYLHP